MSGASRPDQVLCCAAVRGVNCVLQAQLVSWLRGFSEIQGELAACLTALEGGAGQIDSLARPGSAGGESETSATESSVDCRDNLEKQTVEEEAEGSLDEEEKERMDEVFEAFLARDFDFRPGHLGFEDDFVPPVQSCGLRGAGRAGLGNEYSYISGRFLCLLSIIKYTCPGFQPARPI